MSVAADVRLSFSRGVFRLPPKSQKEVRPVKKIILELIQNKDYYALLDVLEELYPADIAALMNELPDAERTLLFRVLKKDTAAMVFSELDSDLQESLVMSVADKELSDVLARLSSDDAADLVEEMPANVVRRILANTKKEQRETINELLKYPEGSAGSVMSVELIKLKANMNIKQAFDYIRNSCYKNDNVYTCYVTDAEARLVGGMTVSDMLFADPDAIIGDIMRLSIACVRTNDDREKAALLMQKYDLPALPVTDTEDRLVGVITFDDALDVMSEEVTEDMHKMAAITPTEQPYLKTSVPEFFKSRAPWLLLLMVSATLTSGILSKFEDALAAQTALVCYIPMLMDTGGNAGSQSSVSVIRALSLGEVSLRNLPAVIWKEGRVALMCGLLLAVCNFAKVMIFDGVSVSLAAVICITLLATVMLAKLVGAALPLAARAVGLDPAVMASPLITTVVDALSLVVYFFVASMLLGL